MIAKTHKAALKKINLKATPKRAAILDILENASVYMSPEEVWDQMRQRFNKIGLPTVYRNLDELAANGFIHNIILPNRQLNYFYCANKSHHHHFICVGCKIVLDIDLCNKNKIKKQVKQKLNGLMLSHLMQINGICENCV
jgi:Fe2+ or Zn2+ uptake regulation protein